MDEISVALVAPSSPASREKYVSALEKAPGFGFKVIKSPSMDAEPTFFTAPKADRLRELRDAEESHAQAIWCIRGGCGAIELWHDYGQEFYRRASAPLIGYSDNTVLHFMRFYFGQRIGIHGPGFVDLNHLTSSDCDVLRHLIQKKTGLIAYPDLKKLWGQDQPVVGEIIPMNLCSLQSLIGCFDANFFRGKILGLEDINEPLYKVYRMMHHLKNAGVLSQLAGLVLGHFNVARREILAQVMMPLVQELNIPLFDWPIFGHDQPNWPLLFGAKVRLVPERDGWFKFSYLQELSPGAR